MQFRYRAVRADGQIQRGVLLAAHPADLSQRLREDVVSESNRRAAFQAVAPETEAGLYLVPKVIE